ncbi:MAG: hypothetical protein DID92_2727745637 [Candidatus Nitrotoga sp. SPKER]|nr:MAG: hypothetical protein DID92_2727745637 [Candidatus Nitrotoga sp. SPKER]
MDFRTYKQFRAYCWQDLQVYIDTPNANAARNLNVVLAGGSLGAIKHELEMALSLHQSCDDLSPRERAAAELLATISNHRAITWQREETPPSGNTPAPPLDESQAEELVNITKKAVERYAAFLPDSERKVLLDDCELLLSSTLVGSSASQEGGSPSIESSLDSLKRKAQEIAQKLGEEQIANTGAWQVNSSSICESVADELAKDSSTHGRQGPQSAGNVRTKLLAGWIFIPPKGEKTEE